MGEVVTVVGGLSSREAAARLARDGGNVLPVRRPVRLWQRVAAQLRDPLVVVLLAAAALTVATGDWTDAAVIAVHHRPVQGTRGAYRVNLRHGVSRVRSGQRHTAGIIFHDSQ